MGVGYDKAITQWSKGQFPFADNTADELAVMRTYLQPVADDFGNTIATAAAYTPGEQGLPGPLRHQRDQCRRSRSQGLPASQLLPLRQRSGQLPRALQARPCRA